MPEWASLPGLPIQLHGDEAVAVGHPHLSNEGEWLAAVLAFGDGAVLSHRSAAALWGIARPTEVIEVTVSGPAGRAERRGINVHRSRTLSHPIAHGETGSR